MQKQENQYNSDSLQKRVGIPRIISTLRNHKLFKWFCEASDTKP